MWVHDSRDAARSWCAVCPWEEAAVGLTMSPTVLLGVQLAFACCAVPAMQAATPIVSRGLPATLPTPVAERLGLYQKGAASSASACDRQVVRYFPGISASLHWLVTGLGFLLSIWCSVATLKHGDVSWYMVLHYCIPLGVCVVDWKFLGHDPPTPLAFGGVAFCLSWALGVMAWRTGSVVPDMEAGIWGLAWMVTMTAYLPMLKRTCMMFKATALERVFYSNLAALVILCTSAAVYNTTLSKDWGGDAGLVERDAERGAVLDGSRRLLRVLLGEGKANGGDGPPSQGSKLVTSLNRFDVAAWFYVVFSSVAGLGLSHVKMELLTHITATSYASFGATALFPVRIWQSFSRVG